MSATTFDPFRSFKFHVVINAIVNASIGFQRVSGLKETSDVVEYREGNMPIHKRKLPGLTNYDPITLQRGATNSNELLNWRAQTAAYGSDGGKGDGVPPPQFRSEMSIFLYDKGDPNSKPVRSWKIHAAWVSDLTEGDLNAEASEVLIEQMVIAHEGMELLANLSPAALGG